MVRKLIKRGVLVEITLPHLHSWTACLQETQTCLQIKPEIISSVFFYHKFSCLICFLTGATLALFVDSVCLLVSICKLTEGNPTRCFFKDPELEVKLHFASVVRH